MSKVLFILIPDNYRDEEFSVPYDMLKDKYQVDVAGFSENIATGARGHEHKPNLLLKDLQDSDFDQYNALVIPGGPGSTLHLWDNQKVLDVIKFFHTNKKIVAAICYAAIPVVQTGILKDKKATVFPSQEAKDIFEQYSVKFVDKGVVVLAKDKIITGQGPKFAQEFGQAIIDMLEK